MKQEDTHHAKKKDNPNRKTVSFADEQPVAGKPKDFNQIYKQACPDDYIRKMITEKVNAKSEQYKQRILKEDNLFKGPPGEVDLSMQMKQWKSQLNKTFLKGTLNLIHINETKLIKRDLEKGIKIIEENTNALGSSDGFSKIGSKLGLSQNSLFASRSEAMIVPEFYTSRSQLKEEDNNGIENVEKTFNKVKEINEKRDEKIKWMKERVKSKENRLKKLEEIAHQKLDNYKEKRLENRQVKLEEAKKRAIERSMREKEFRKVLKRKPLYEEINEKFNSTLEMKTLEKKKQALASIRSLHQPLDFRKIEEEQLQKEALNREKNEEYRKRLAEKLKLNQDTYDKNKYSNRYYERMLQEEEEKLNAEYEKEEYKRNLHPKMRSYGDSVKNKFIPAVSKKKQDELKRIRKSLEMPAREKYKHKTVLSDPDERERIHNERMKVYKSLPRKKLNQTPTVPKHGSMKDYLKEFRMSKKSAGDSKSYSIPKSK